MFIELERVEKPWLQSVPCFMLTKKEHSLDSSPRVEKPWLQSVPCFMLTKKEHSLDSSPRVEKPWLQSVPCFMLTKKEHALDSSPRGSKSLHLHFPSVLRLPVRSSVCISFDSILFCILWPFWHVAKYSHSLRITCNVRSESAREQRIGLYKSYE